MVVVVDCLVDFDGVVIGCRGLDFVMLVLLSQVHREVDGGGVYVAVRDGLIVLFWVAFGT